MRQWLGDRWVQIRYEDTVADLELQARRAVAICQLDWDKSVLDYRHVARDDLANSPSRAEAVQPLYTRAIGRWKNYMQQIEPHLGRLRQILVELGYS
jgi:hypothetical protein